MYTVFNLLRIIVIYTKLCLRIYFTTPVLELGIQSVQSYNLRHLAFVC